MKKESEEIRTLKGKIESLERELSVLKDQTSRYESIFDSSLLSDMNLNAGDERGLREILARIGDVIFQLHLPDMNFGYISPAVEHVFGYTAEDFRNKPNFLFRVAHPDSRNYLHNVWKVIRSGKLPPLLEYKIIDNEGQTRWIRQKNTFHYDSKHKPIAFEGICQDISEYKIYEKELKRMTLAVEQSANSVVITDVLGNIEYVNKKFTEITGYSKEEAKGKNPRILKSGHQSLKFYQELWDTISHGDEWRGEFHNIDKYENPFWEFATIAPIRDENGSISQYIAIKENISERKIAEERLKESEEQLRTVINATEDIICLKDGDGRWLLANNANLELYQLQGTEYAGKTDAELANYVPFFRESLIASMIDDEKTWQSRDARRHDTELTLPSGEKRIFDMQKIPLYHENMSRKGLVVFGRDITKRKMAEKAHLKAKERAEEADRLKTAFLANMSHEIRTPMNSILGFCDLLMEKKYDENTRNYYLELISKSSMQLLHIINDILDISKIEVDQLSIHFEVCNINRIFQELYDTFSPRMQEKKKVELKMIRPLADEEVNILTDENRLKQILINLISNAIKFTERGWVEFSYRIVEVNEQQMLRLAVRDTGIGISTGEQNLIFERFHQLDASHSRRYGGTGLGLSISKGLVHLLGGTINLESDPGKGSTFSFIIPYEKKETERNRPSNDENLKQDYNWKGRKILLVEDDKPSVLIVKKMLQALNPDLLIAENGYQALETLAKNRDINLVLMDMQMPLMNGFEACRRIREQSFTIPIIAQTANALSDDRARCLEAGCSDYISKPFRKKELISLIDQYIH